MSYQVECFSQEDGEHVKRLSTSGSLDFVQSMARDWLAMDKSHTATYYVTRIPGASPAPAEANPFPW